MPKPKGHSGNWGGRKEGTYLWYEIQDAVDYCEAFEKPKIIIPAIVQRPEITIEVNNIYSNDKTCIIASNSNYLLAILNSKVTDLVMQLISSTKQGGFFEYKPVYISQIPIPTASNVQQQAIESLVTRILAAKQTDPKSDTTVLESEVDALVYGLYGLTEEEIAIVEGT